MFCEAVQHRLRTCLDPPNFVKMAAFQFYLQSGKQSKESLVEDSQVALPNIVADKGSASREFS
jgi:hypothetical protein